MKRLLLVRHAKSSWKHSSLPDHERPLNRRGERNRWQLGAYLREHPAPLQRIDCSTAVRARLTAEAIAAQTPLREAAALYTFARDALIDYLRNLDNSLTCIALVGHNPALTELANWLECSPTGIDNLPTASLIEFELSIGHWAQVGPGCAKRLRLQRVRQLP